MRVARIDLLHPDPTNALGRVEIRFPEIEFDYFDTDLFTPAYIVSYFECVLGSQNVDAAGKDNRRILIIRSRHDHHSPQ
jgi:hypothetical protein